MERRVVITSNTQPPTCWIVAGPNGAGKTTFALHYLPQVAHCSRFINADLIAAGLSPLAPERELLTASRIFLGEVQQAIEERDDFAFETTLSGRSYMRLVKQLLSEGWRVELVYLALPSVEMSRLRVAERVSHGGHDIPSKDIQRRFPRSLRNLLTLFAPCVTRARCFMNDGDMPELVFEQRGSKRDIINDPYFQLICKESAS
ncbi:MULTISPECIES: zeta toxin family protein [Halomonadaceae]|uniref:zeta toxin family protein n=1 Tax=Halomonadaceae TaxID=28256 RepID=UPI001C3CE4F7|nr:MULTISPECIES: zeta toxin family protein [unclassified Halomonas]